MCHLKMSCYILDVWEIVIQSLMGQNILSIISHDWQSLNSLVLLHLSSSCPHRVATISCHLIPTPTCSPARHSLISYSVCSLPAPFPRHLQDCLLCSVAFYIPALCSTYTRLCVHDSCLLPVVVCLLLVLFCLPSLIDGLPWLWSFFNLYALSTSLASESKPLSTDPLRTPKKNLDKGNKELYVY